MDFKTIRASSAQMLSEQTLPSPYSKECFNDKIDTADTLRSNPGSQVYIGHLKNPNPEWQPATNKFGLRSIQSIQVSSQKINLASLKTIDTGEDARQRFRFTNQYSFGEMISSAEGSPTRQRASMIIEEESNSLQRSSEAMISTIRQQSPPKETHNHMAFKNTPEFGQQKNMMRSMSPPSHLGLRDYLYRSHRPQENKLQSCRSVAELGTSESPNSKKRLALKLAKPVSIESISSPPQSSGDFVQSITLNVARSSPGRYAAAELSQTSSQVQSERAENKPAKRPFQPKHFHLIALAAFAIVLLVIEVIRCYVLGGQGISSY